MGVKVTGATDLRRRFENTGKAVSRVGSEALRRGALMIRNRSRDYAPVEFENLEQSITMDSENLGRNHWAHRIFVDKSFPATERGSSITVGKYADIVHEGGMGGIGNGPGSRAKAAALGVDVGPFFMSRAFEELTPVVKRDVDQAVAYAVATGMSPNWDALGDDEEGRISALRSMARNAVRQARKASTSKTKQWKIETRLRRAKGKKVKTAKVAKPRVSKIKVVGAKSKTAVNAAVKAAVKKSTARTATIIRTKVVKAKKVKTAKPKVKVAKPKKVAVKKVSIKKTSVKRVTSSAKKTPIKKATIKKVKLKKTSIKKVAKTAKKTVRKRSK